MHKGKHVKYVQYVERVKYVGCKKKGDLTTRSNQLVLLPGHLISMVVLVTISVGGEPMVELSASTSISSTVT